MLSGVSVAGAELAGHDAEAARRQLTERARALGQTPLRLRLGERETSVTVAEAGFELLPRESAELGLRVGRDAGPLANALTFLRSAWREHAVPGRVSVDAARFDAALVGISAKLIDDPPFAGTIAFEQAKPQAVPPRAGRKIKRAELLAAMREAAARGASEIVDVSVEVVTPPLTAAAIEAALVVATRALSRPVVLEAEARRLEMQPAELGACLVGRVEGEQLVLALDTARVDAWLAPRRAELEAPARDARFEVSPSDEVRIVPSEAGVRLDTARVASALWEAARSDAGHGELPLEREPLPARSTEQAEKLGIVKLVSTFTTRHPCCQPRVANIHRIATLMDGLVVEPGQTVSVNRVVGPRTQKNGFVPAPSIEDGEMVDTVGGGVSQFATTFFNAILHAGYDIIERQPHTYWFPRYPMGHEATLSWPQPDIVFKNDSDAGLLVKTSFSKTTITVKLYGDVGGRRVTSHVSERRDIVKPSVELLPNREVEPDEEKVKDGGMIGWSVIASRTVTFADGTKKEEKRKVTYKPKARRVEVHPCRIPKGEPGATGEPCPEPEDVEEPAEVAAPAEAAAPAE